MNVEQISELDAAWSRDLCDYQVWFWNKLNNPEPPSAAWWESDCYRVSNVLSVAEVIDWAEANADGRPYTIHLEFVKGVGERPGIIRVYGDNPTAD